MVKIKANLKRGNIGNVSHRLQLVVDNS